MKTTAAIFALALSTALIFSGCASKPPVDGDGRIIHKQFEVEVSGLDWIEIVYFPASDDPEIRNICRLSIYGTGEIQFRTGRSPRLADAFSDAVNDPYWNDYYSDRIHLDREGIQQVYQFFVDEGIVPKNQTRVNKQPYTKPYITVAAQIGNEKVRLLTGNKHLVQLTEEAMENFRPTIREASMAVDAEAQVQK